MISWVTIFYNLVWIIGVATIMAAFSYHDWQATLQGLKLRQQLSEPAFQTPFLLGLILTGLGFFLIASVWWERLIWVIFISSFIVQMWHIRNG